MDEKRKFFEETRAKIDRLFGSLVEAGLEDDTRFPEDEAWWLKFDDVRWLWNDLNATVKK